MRDGNLWGGKTFDFSHNRCLPNCALYPQANRAAIILIIWAAAAAHVSWCLTSMLLAVASISDAIWRYLFFFFFSREMNRGQDFSASPIWPRNERFGICVSFFFTIRVVAWFAPEGSYVKRQQNFQVRKNKSFIQLKRKYPFAQNVVLFPIHLEHATHFRNSVLDVIVISRLPIRP